MNYLAHLTLSHFSAELQVGNYLGDLVKGRQVDALPPTIVRGIEMHRAIDRATDRDVDVRLLNASLRQRHGRYAAVISDICFDHFLYLNWAALGPEPFGSFCDLTYARLIISKPLMSPEVSRYVDGMTAGNWLGLYTTKAGMASVFRRLRKRLSQPELLNGIDRSLDDLGPEINLTLLRLFPRLQSLAATYRDPTQTDRSSP